MKKYGIPGTRLYTGPFPLEAVGMDDDGEVKPIEKLSFNFKTTGPPQRWIPRILGPSK